MRPLPSMSAAFAVAVTLVASLLWGASAAQAAEGVGFRAAPCDHVDVPSGARAGIDYRCGILTAPLRHDQPGAATVELPVLILGRDGASQPPLYVMQGGPGSQAASAFIGSFIDNRGRSTALLADRQVVIMEQRGTPWASPALLCDGPTFLCRAELEADGTDVPAFGTLANAADHDLLRRSLGQSRIDVYGTSYGTHLALQYVRLFPDSARAVILDAVVSPVTSPWLYQARSFNEAINRLGAECKASPRCNAMTDFEKDFFRVVDRMNAAPRVMVVRVDGQERRISLSGISLIGLLQQATYDESLIAAIPAAVARAS